MLGSGDFFVSPARSAIGFDPASKTRYVSGLASPCSSAAITPVVCSSSDAPFNSAQNGVLVTLIFTMRPAATLAPKLIRDSTEPVFIHDPPTSGHPSGVR